MIRPCQPTSASRLIASALRWAVSTSKVRVLVVEDFDFIDGTSRKAMMACAADPRAARLLVVLTYTPTRAPAQDPPEKDRFVLDPLPRHIVEGLLPPGMPVDGPPILPLHLDQLIAWSHETQEAPPEHLVDLVARRVERLRPRRPQCPRRARGLGGTTPSRPFSRRASCPGAPTSSPRSESLRKARLVTRHDGAVRTAHALIRRVAFANIPAGRRGEFFELAAALRPDAPLEVRAKQVPPRRVRYLRGALAPRYAGKPQGGERQTSAGA